MNKDKLKQLIDESFNEGKLDGIGKLAFGGADALVLNESLMGYELKYINYEFN